MAMNKIVCVADIKNTGICGCFFDPKLIYGGILVPAGRVFTEEELSAENVAATFNDLILAAKGSRGFPFIVWNGITDNSEDPTIFTSGYGVPEPVREGSYNWLAAFRRGGVDLNNALRSFNGLTGKYSLLLVEQTNKLIGTKKLDANGEIGTAGLSLETLNTYPWKVADGTNPAQYRTQIAFRPEQLNEAIAYHAIDVNNLNLLTLNGLTTVELTATTFNGTTGVIIAETDCGEDIYDQYADELELTAAWTGIALSNGAVVAPTTVVKNAAGKGWTVTFAAPVSQVNLAAPAVLAVAPVNVVGYEGIAIDFGS